MNSSFFWEKLQHSDVFKDFMKENPKPYFFSGFFTIDKEGKDNQRHFDFYVPKTEKMFSFKMDDGVEKVEVEMVAPKIPEKITSGFDFEFEDVVKMIEDEMVVKKVNKKIQKILISLQYLDGKNFLICTVFIASFGILKIHIDLDKKGIVLFEKKSLFDIVKKVK